MSTWTIPGGDIDTDSLVLRGIKLATTNNRDRNTDDYLTIKIGYSDGPRTSYIGEWTQRTHRLNKGTPLELLHPNALDKRLIKGYSFVIVMETTGVVPDSRDMAITFHAERVGGTSAQERALLAGADESSAEQVNRSGLTKETWTVPLVNQFDSSNLDVTVKDENDSATDDHATLTLATASYVYGAAVTLTPATPGDTYVAMVWANCTVNPGTGTISARLRNSTDATALQTIAGLVAKETILLMAREEITAAKTYDVGGLITAGGLGPTITSARIMGLIVRREEVISVELSTS